MMREDQDAYQLREKRVDHEWWSRRCGSTRQSESV